jgi:hypothetical protein
MRAELELPLLTVAIYACYLYYGVLQERLTGEGFTNPRDPTGPRIRFTATFFLLGLQCVCNALAAMLVRALIPRSGTTGTPVRHEDVDADKKGGSDSHSGGPGGRRRVHPIVAFLPCALSYVAAMFFSNASLTIGAVSYPTMALAKR